MKKAPIQRGWITPTGNCWDLYTTLSKETHLLIAGSTGSGKSCAAAGILQSILTRCAPSDAQLILIDPKMTELGQYAALPHTIAYAYRHADIVKALEYTVGLMEERLYRMKQTGARMYRGSRVYLIIDELADLMLTLRKQARPLLQRILQLARAANICCIACTQVTLAKVIPTEIKINFTGILGLKVPLAQNSRLVIDRNGCELFPDPAVDHVAYGYYKHGCACQLYRLPMVSDADLQPLIWWWTSRNCIAC